MFNLRSLSKDELILLITKIEKSTEERVHTEIKNKYSQNWEFYLKLCNFYHHLYPDTNIVNLLSNLGISYCHINGCPALMSTSPMTLGEKINCDYILRCRFCKETFCNKHLHIIQTEKDHFRNDVCVNCYNR